MVRPLGSKNKTAKFNRPVADYAPPSLDKDPVPNFDLLDEFSKDELRKKARAKIEAQERARAEEAFLQAEMDRMERELHPEAYEPTEEVLIDLAVYADRIVLDGRHYMHGRTYTVKQSTARSMRDIMARTKRHYEETHRDPAKAQMEAQQAIAKGGPSYATVSANTGQITKGLAF